MGATNGLIGQTLMWGLAVTNLDGEPADVGIGPTCTITLPDGTTAAATVVHPALGSYLAAYAPNRVGLHWATWSGSGVNSAGLPSVEAIMVEAPAGLVAVTADDLAGHIHADIAEGDQLVAQDVCARASARVREHCDPARLAAATADGVASVQLVMLRLAARMWNNPLERASYTGPEGLSYVTTSPRILTDDERATLSPYRKLEGFA